MPVAKNDSASTTTTLPDKDQPVLTKRPSRVPFSFGAGNEDAAPEMTITTTISTVSGSPVATTGIDLSGKNKVIFSVGRGKTGKTTLIRWLAETALASDGSFLMADMDPTNDTFSKYLDGVARPSEAGDSVLALKWLEALLQHALQSEMSVLIDLGGGDTTLRRLVAQLPDLVAMFEAAGFAVVVLYTVGSQEEDLTPLATMQSLGFTPTATAIVLNEGLVEVGDDRAATFARISRHSVFRAPLNQGAVPVWMPKLLPAAQIEIRRLHYRDAAVGYNGQGTLPLGPFDRARVGTWLKAIEGSFAGIATWLP